MDHLLEEFMDKSYISTKDVLALRQNVFGDDLLDWNEAEQLIQLATQVPNGDPTWNRFYSEAMADLFCHQKMPRGYMSDNDAVFLIKTYGSPDLANDVKVNGLVHMFKQAIHVPDSLIEYGLEVVRAHVLADGKISALEVEQLRVFLFAAGGHGNVAVTKQEAELLCDLNDASRHENNDPAWVDLFMKGIANYLMVKIGYQAPSRKEALRRANWLNDQSVNTGSFLQRMASGGLGAVRSAYRKPSTATRTNIFGEKAASPEEAAWLAQRIGRDGKFDDAEKAVIGHLRSLSEDLPPELAKLVQAV